MWIWPPIPRNFARTCKLILKYSEESIPFAKTRKYLSMFSSDLKKIFDNAPSRTKIMGTVLASSVTFYNFFACFEVSF